MIEGLLKITRKGTGTSQTQDFWLDIHSLPHSPELFLFASETRSKKQEAMEFGPLYGPPMSYKDVTLMEYLPG